MTAIAQKLDAKMKQWQPTTAKQVERLVDEISQAADQDALALTRSRKIEQEVLDMLEEPKAR